MPAETERMTIAGEIFELDTLDELYKALSSWSCLKLGGRVGFVRKAEEGSIVLKSGEGVHFAPIIKACRENRMPYMIEVFRHGELRYNRQWLPGWAEERVVEFNASGEVVIPTDTVSAWLQEGVSVLKENLLNASCVFAINEMGIKIHPEVKEELCGRLQRVSGSSMGS